MASIVHRINSNRDAGLSHCWTLEKLFDESQITGELNLSGRNLKKYPEYAKQCDMEDTIVAGNNMSFISGLVRDNFSVLTSISHHSHQFHCSL